MPLSKYDTTVLCKCSVFQIPFYILGAYSMCDSPNTLWLPHSHNVKSKRRKEKKIFQAVTAVYVVCGSTSVLYMKLSLYNTEIGVFVNKQEGIEEASLKQRFILGSLPGVFLWPLAMELFWC